MNELEKELRLHALTGWIVALSLAFFVFLGAVVAKLMFVALMSGLLTFGSIMNAWAAGRGWYLAYKIAKLKKDEPR